MKKILYATTAIAAVSAISAANAQESAMMSAAGNDLSIGGYYEFGYANRSDDFGGDDDGADAFNYGDSELFIDFETTSDSGLTYGVQLDFEVVNGNEHAESGPAKNAEESSIYISGNFGTIHLGHDDYASDLYNVWAPTHEGAYSQYDSIYGARYGDGAIQPSSQDNVTNPIGDSAATIFTFLNRAAAQANNANDDAAAARIVALRNNYVTGEDTELTADEVTMLNGRNAALDQRLDGGNTLRGKSLNLAYTASLTQGSDEAKVTYVSPNLGGISFGASFADSDSSENSPTALGASFTGSVDRIPFVGGGFSYKFSGWQYGNSADGVEEVKKTHYGLNIGFGDLTLTVAQLDGDISDTNAYEVTTTEFGVGYAINDALSVGFSTADASNDNTNEEGTFQSTSVSYTIAPGLKTTASHNVYEAVDRDALLLNNGSEIVWQVEFSF